MRFLLLLSIFCLSACKQSNNYIEVETIRENSNFKYNELGRIILDCRILDTTSMSLIFDTGGNGNLILEKSFADSLFCYDYILEKEYFKNGWNFTVDYPVNTVYDSITVWIENKEVVFEKYYLLDKKYFDFGDAKGLISIPKNDDRIWEINYENKFVNIVDTIISVKNDLVLDIVRSDDQNSFITINDFPFEFIRGNSSFTCFLDIMIDTGKGEGIALHMIDLSNDLIRMLNDSTVLRFIQKSSPHIEKNWYYLHVGGIINDDIWIEYSRNKRLYSIPGEIKMIVAGNNFLKRYNIMIDLSKMKIYLSPIQFRDINSELETKISLFMNEDGYAVLYYIDNNFFLSDGNFEIGDVFEKVNNQLLYSLPRNYFDKLESGDTVTVVFTRRDQKMETKVVKP